MLSPASHSPRKRESKCSSQITFPTTQCVRARIEPHGRPKEKPSATSWRSPSRTTIRGSIATPTQPSTQSKCDCGESKSNGNAARFNHQENGQGEILALTHNEGSTEVKIRTDSQEDRSSIERYYSRDFWAARPKELGWTRTVDRKTQLILRVRCIRLSDGQRVRWYFTCPRPTTKIELADMQRRLVAVQKQIVEFRKGEARDVVAREKVLVRQPRRKKRRR